MFYSDDPIRDHERYEAQRERRLKRLPRCCECGHPIQTEECFLIDGELVCPECLVEHHQKRTDDYTE